MKINKIISAILILEFAFYLYRVVNALLYTFSPSELMPYVIIFSIITLPLISALGIFFNKKWGVIVLWVFILIPFILKTSMPFLTFIGVYYFTVINTLIATYLSIKFWSNKKTNTQAHQ